ncbi:hypothetical protein RHP47_00365 [Thermosynechococcus sp. QKsg1]|uniref:hypothetical protein n=1 Tax=unclassified Thermosynechococcus TaxID=2622553 RepID=UPI00122E3B10|nr:MULTISPECIES: hypothetical protein [unclassified Thermosynechococcus]QEP99978.1 hypothetical protein FFX45_00375 [Thermosynechococcus sp. CL-1]WJI24169.1 hypothetical protein MZ909_00375 [Thermosynechococcus sp. B0]WJI26682.1 hypothetical protein M0644_00375 [Thermosynechococcus sp. B1]WJI29210.1 hypothetical protein M0646_00375 [Thermosynechococcus sp. B3]WKT83803.1 hypothetical protein QYC28_00370 [Thermosynechococcus sp. HY596]
MTRSDDPQRTDPYTMETCLTDVQANRLLDEVFAAVEADLNEPESLAAVLEPEPSLLVPFEATTPPPPPPPAEPSRWLHRSQPQQAFSWGDRFLMGVGIASFVLGVGLWISLNRQPVAVAPEGAVTTTTSPADMAFAEYLQTSLQLLSQQAATPTPSPPAIASNSVPTPSTPTPTVERIYVPVYQAPSAPTVTLPNLPTVTAPSPAPTPTPPSPAPAPPQHTLVGILELGDRSVALFQSNGQTLRLSVGDTIGNDGWQLVQIQNQRAVLRRQGEVRSLTVGQSF